MAIEPGCAPLSEYQASLDRNERNIIRQVSAEIARYFANLPAGMVDQQQGQYEPGCPACVGAHLAHYIRGKHWWSEGREGLARALGTTHAHIYLLLRRGGAPRDPFGYEPWQPSPEHVFGRLARTTKPLPGLTGADLAMLDLQDHDFMHRPLAGTSFRGSCLHGADFALADLQGADLRGAHCESASFRQADLRRADLTGAHCDGASFLGANLQDADLTAAVLHGCELRNTGLTAAQLAAAHTNENTTRGVFP